MPRDPTFPISEHPLTTSQRYSPELKERAIAMRDQREKEFDEYVTQLKEISKSKKNSAYPSNVHLIW